MIWWIVLLLVLSGCDAAVGERLPSTYGKIAYNIDLNITERALSGDAPFSGTARLGLRLTNDTQVIYLHSQHDYIRIIEITMDAVAIKDYTLDNNTDILTIRLPDKINAATSLKLKIDYESRISTDDMNGLYKVSYKRADGSYKHMAFSNFEPIYARRVFPCLDEPSFKAKFQLTAVVPEKNKVFFNTDEISGISSSFRKTPLLSTSQLSIAVTDFSGISGPLLPGLQYTLYADRIQSNYTNFAIETTTELWTRYCKLLDNGNLPGQIDIVAVPEGMVRSTGSWGLITCSEENILFDKNKSADFEKQNVITSLSNTLGQQWFGTIVVKWWSYVYLKLGLAEFFAYYISHRAYPNYELDKQFVIECVQKAMELDASEETVALQKDCNNDSAILTKFGDIFTYKGASIFWMIYHFMGSQNFEGGIKELFLNQALYNLDSEDVWSILYQYDNDSISLLPAHLSNVMDSWVKEPGFPLVTVQMDGRKLTIEQEPFSFTKTNSKAEWYIPITYTLSTDPNRFEKTAPMKWIKPHTGKVDLLTAADGVEWILLNNQVTGLYRVNYDDVLWGKIVEALNKDDFDGIPELSRSQIVDDAFNLARAGKLKYSRLFEIVSFLKRDTSYYPWYTALRGFNFLLDIFDEESALGNDIKNHLATLMDNVYHSVKEMNEAQVDQIAILKQNLIFKWACRLDIAECLQESMDAFERYQKEGIRPNINIEEVLFCNAMARSNITQWNFLFSTEGNNASNMPTGNSGILFALGCSRDRNILERYLKMTISYDYRLQDGHFATIFKSVYEGSPEGLKASLAFLEMYHENIFQKHKYRLYTIMELIVGMASTFSSRAEIDKLTAIMEKPEFPQELKSVTRKALQNAENNMNWADTHRKQLESYYQSEVLKKSSVIIISVSVIAGLLLSLAIGTILYKYRARISCRVKETQRSSGFMLMPLGE